MDRFQRIKKIPSRLHGLYWPQYRRGGCLIWEEYENGSRWSREHDSEWPPIHSIQCQNLLTEEFLIVVVISDPEPGYGVFIENSEGAVAKRESYRPDVFFTIDTLES